MWRAGLIGFFATAAVAAGNAGADAPTRSFTHVLEERQTAAHLRKLARAVAADERDRRLHLLLGAALIRAGRAEDAIERADAALARWPYSAELNLLKGLALTAGPTAGATELAEAAGCFRRALGSIEPATRASAHLALASVLDRQGDPRGANRHYRRALAIDPQLERALVSVQKELLWQVPQAPPREAKDAGGRRLARLRSALDELQQDGVQPMEEKR